MKANTTSNQRAGTPDVRQAIIGWLIRAAAGIVLVGVILFFAAGQLNWINGWAYLAVYVVVSVASVFFTDPSLLAERSTRRQAGQKSWDRVLLGLYGSLVPVVIPVVAGLNLRFGWPPEVALWVEVLALMAYLLGWAVHLWAMSTNKYFALVVRIQDDRGQTVATGGPYRWVRHPGYVGGIMVTLGAPLVLGSWWALIPGVLGAVLLVVRTALEDRTLQDELTGYSQYARQVRYRLLPGLW